MPSKSEKGQTVCCNNALIVVPLRHVVCLLLARGTGAVAFVSCPSLCGGTFSVQVQDWSVIMNNERLCVPMDPKILAMWEQDRRCGHHPCNCIRVVRIMVHWCTGCSGRWGSVEYLLSLSTVIH